MLHIRSDRRPYPHGRALAAGAALWLWLGLAVSAQALTVFACEPEWGALAKALAPQAQVHSATHWQQDPHHIEARPSLIATLRRADLAVCTGAELESGWLPMLQQRAGNPRVQDGADGMFYASEYVELIDPQPGGGGPFAGDVHAAGNPHVHADPRRILEVGEALARRLGEVDPGNRARYQQQWSAFEADWRQRIARWEREAEPLKGMRVVAQHSTYAYLWKWLGIQQVADLEPKPGMPPTPGHLQRVLAQVREAPPQALIVASHQDGRAAQWLAHQLGRPGGRGVPVLDLPSTVSDDATAPDLAAFFDRLVTRLREAR